MATPGTAYTAPDGSEGTPYILARGQSIEVQSDIDLTGPSTATVGSSATFVAGYRHGRRDGLRLDVTFTAKPGSAHEGVLGTVATNSDGVAALEFTGATAGSDIIVASFVDGDSLTQTSGPLTITWAAPATPNRPPPSRPRPTGHARAGHPRTGHPGAGHARTRHAGPGDQFARADRRPRRSQAGRPGRLRGRVRALLRVVHVLLVR